jgi:hypothetical protein
MTTYYKKQGRKYVPVMESEMWSGDAKPLGFHLVHVKPGSTSWNFRINPDLVEVIAATKIIKDAMIDKMFEVNKGKLNENRYPEHVREKAKKAWKAWLEIMGEDVPMSFEGVSMHDLVEAGIKELENHLWENKK